MQRLSILVGLVTCSALFGADIHEKALNDSIQSAPEAKVDVIVRYRQSPGEAQHARVRFRGGALKQDLASLHAAAYRIPAGRILELAKDPEILSISPDHPISATGAAVPFMDNPDFGWMGALGVSSWSASAPYTGAGVGVAVIDSGIGNSNYPELSSGTGKKATYQVVYQQSFVPGDASTADTYGHGSHVAGIIAAQSPGIPEGSAGYSVRGVAPGVQLVSLPRRASSQAFKSSS